MNYNCKNAIVGQSGGPTAAINATLVGVIRGAKAAMTRGELGTIYGMKNGIEGLLAESLLDIGGLSEDELNTLACTPSAALGSCRKKLPSPQKDEQAYREILRICEKYRVGYFFYIGGNDSMDTVLKLSDYAARVGYDLKVVGIPKTIDNDLMATDHTPGFGSAAKFVATTIKEFLCDVAVYTVPAVTIVEIMGRDAGWLTAAAGLPKLSGMRAPDLIYLPESAFDPDKFLADVRLALQKHPAVLVAVSEGVRSKDGTYVGEAGQSGSVDVFGHRYLSGTGKVLEQMVKEAIGCKVRSVELSLTQRCAAHIASKTDIDESLRIGEAGLNAALGGASGVMMTFVRADGDYGVTIGCEKIENIANGVKTVPAEFINSEGNYVTDACLAHLAPLIRGEMTVSYENGLPKHYVFR